MPLKNLDHKQTMRLLQQNFTIGSIRYVTFGLEDMLKETQVNGSVLEILNEVWLSDQWKITDKENRDQLLSYIAYHNPAAKMISYEEKILCDLTHEESMQLLLQDPVVREIILTKAKKLKKNDIDG